MQHFNTIIFNILNSLAGILSLPLALLVAVLHKAHLTSSSSPGRTDAEVEAPILRLLDAKSRLTGKDPDAGKG